MIRRERGGLDPQDGDVQTEIAIERCLDAARKSVEMISTYWDKERRTMLACWHGSNYLLQAIAIPIICLRNDPQASRAVEWRDLIVQAMRVLESMAQLKSSLSRCLELIRFLCGTFIDSSQSEWGCPIVESAQTQLTTIYPLMWPTLKMARLEGVGLFL